MFDGHFLCDSLIRAVGFHVSGDPGLAQRESLTAVVRDEALLTEDTREDVLEYLDDFWETIQDERDARRRIEERCRRI